MINNDNTMLSNQVKHAILELGRMIEHIDRFDEDSINLSRKMNGDRAIESMSALSDKIIEENQV